VRLQSSAIFGTYVMQPVITLTELDRAFSVEGFESPPSDRSTSKVVRLVCSRTSEVEFLFGSFVDAFFLVDSDSRPIFRFRGRVLPKLFRRFRGRKRLE
jgi:hypothetical protein